MCHSLMETLTNLFNKYGSDKARNGYVPLYETLFRARRSDPISLLEVGIGTMIEGVHSSMVGYALPGYKPGGSLRAWRDYFPNACISGCDVQPDTQFTDEERITTYLCNSTQSADVTKTFDGKMFDIIVDDGSHAAMDQISTLHNMLPHLKKDGIYVIEDVHEGSYVSTHNHDVQAMFPQTHQFLVGLKNNQLVIIFK